MLDHLAVLDEILERHAEVLGRDYHPYRNHTYRVANFHWCMLPGTVHDLYVLSVAVAFHDLGIWTAGTFDYLAPSKRWPGSTCSNRTGRNWCRWWWR